MNQPQAIIIEFVGPPGAGKTSCCRQLAKVLEVEGNCVCQSHDIKEYIHDLSPFAKLGLYFQTLVTKLPQLLHYVVFLGLSHIYSRKAVYRYFRLLAFERALTSLIRKSEIDIVLLDQWSIQELWSAAIFTEVSYDKLTRSLMKFYQPTDFTIYCEVDSLTAAERIGQRETKLSRFDRLDFETRLIELNKYSSFLYNLYTNANGSQKYLLSTSRSLPESVEQIMNFISLRVNKSLVE